MLMYEWLVLDTEETIQLAHKPIPGQESSLHYIADQDLGVLAVQFVREVYVEKGLVPTDDDI